MTAEQFESARTLNINIDVANGRIDGLADTINSLKYLKYDLGRETATLQITATGGSENFVVQSINLLDLIYFLKKQKSDWEDEVKRLKEEFDKL